MKKLFIFAAILAVSAGFMLMPSAGFAGTLEEECDIVFQQTVRELYPEETEITVQAERNLLYNVRLEPTGYVYDFLIMGQRGYAIVTCTDNVFHLDEIYFESENPYRDEANLCVYAGPMKYWSFNGQGYIDILTEQAIPDEIVAEYFDGIYSEVTLPTYDSQIVYYTQKTVVDDYKMVHRFPTYSIINGTQNACAPIAGGNIVGYFDRYYDELIPNSTAGRMIGNYYFYNTQNNEIEDSMYQLYQKMGTNSTGSGTTISQFKNGMTQYCREKNRSISYNNCMSTDILNFDIMKENMNNNRPVVFFLSGYNVGEIIESEGKDEFSYYYSSGAHAMVAFGYKKISYLVNGSSPWTDYYVNVASGLAGRDKGFFNLARAGTKIDDAFGVGIS